MKEQAVSEQTKQMNHRISDKQTTNVVDTILTTAYIVNKHAHTQTHPRLGGTA